MKRKKKITFGITAVLLVAVYLYYFIQNEKSLNISLAGEEEDNNLNQESKIHEDDRHGKDTNRPRYSRHWKNGIHLSVVACGDRAEETIVLLKSAVLFTTGPLIFHIFAEFDFQPMFKQKSLLKDVDSLLYVDTDILFLRPVDDIWRFFDQFNSAQLAALVPEHEDKAASNYRFARHPYYGESGLNSGVLLMNLTRIRKSTWIDSMVKYYIQYKPIIRYGDQDLLNIYFYHHIDELYVYSCEWNYRTDHCVNKSICKDIERNGVSVLHGSRRVMQNEDQPTFKAVYTAFKEHNISLRKERDLLTNLKKLLSKTSNSPCGQIGHLAYTKYIEEFVLERKTS
ncbi:glucoside xylosyltransferase 1-like isoform X2 [Mytilus californianus]|uniref:glucoside xylosyltransferase 1-like isoform X2 n=1 Tax=Mytilus californianus TaxID=6549 RepID=UPI0022473C5B|nr:glucoside xylosyltransferase 1-like isoform X2 [Mytilus californianus]